MIKVTQRRSTITSLPKHRGTIRALGLRGIGSSHVLPDNEAVRGMIRSVSHLIEHEPVTGQE